MALFIGRQYYCFDELTSTNDHLAALLASGRPAEGTVVRALHQTAGRGQPGTQWHSEPGRNLTLSILLYPDWLDVQRQFDLNIAVALGLLDAVQTLLGMADVRIKWPNDLYLGHRKTAGILIQNALSGSRLQSAVVGIGLNVNQTDFAGALPNATSLAVQATQLLDLSTVEDALFTHIEQRYLQLRAGHHAPLRRQYTQCLYGVGETRTFERPNGDRFTGIITGVAQTGHLQVQTTAAETETFAPKELRFLQHF